MSSFTYSITYNQRGISENGFLITQPSSGWLWLKNRQKETINKGKVGDNVMKLITVESNNKKIMLGGFDIIIHEEIARKIVEVENNVDLCNTTELAADENQPLLKKTKHEVAIDNPVSITTGPSMDPVLEKVMRPHQLEGAKFLLDKLLGVHNDRERTDIEKSLCIDLSIVTGAILADEMGTGKSLTALCVLWAICRNGRAKGVIVCPSSLVGNWEAEINRWLPNSLSYKALYVKKTSNSGKNSADAIVNQFIISHAAVHPVLIISYDMFRIFSEALNTVNTFEVLVCDEGHRLKNALGTKTTSAIDNCIATRRLILTGTPIQNNLGELYAVVNAVSPGYLGDFNQYKAMFLDPIMNGKASNSSSEGSPMLMLRHHLSNILLRRTRDDVMSSILPPKKSYLLFCPLTSQQKLQYICEKEKICTTLDVNGKEGSSPSNVKGILPNLLRLRQISNGMEVEGDGSATPSVTVAHELQASNKLTVLNQFLTSLRFLNETKSVKDKVVIVSNFIKTLDKINMLANSKRWPLLRLDGNTKPQERVALVNKFNTGPYFLMLLSAKAGGVGLNLTGANRLILVDPDWNPATDLQALGRIWREGQTKPVFIYRLLSSDTIDESILRRQKDKGILTSVIQHETDRGDDATKENEEDFVEEVVSDCNILSLMLPNGIESFSLEDNSEKGDSKDRTPCAGIVQDDLFSINDMPNYFSKILEE